MHRSQDCVERYAIHEAATNLGLKLALSFSVIILTAMAASLYSLSTQRQVRKQLLEITGNASRLDQARQITIALANMRSGMRGITLFALQNNTDQLNKTRRAFEASAAQIRLAAQKIQGDDLTQEDRAAVSAILSGVDQWQENFPEFVSLCVSAHVEEAHQITLKKTTPIMDVLQRSALQFGEANHSRQDAAETAAKAALQRNERLTEVFVGGFMALLLLVGAAVYALIRGLFQTLKGMAETLARGAELGGKRGFGALVIQPGASSRIFAASRVTRNDRGFHRGDHCTDETKLRASPGMFSADGSRAGDWQRGHRSDRAACGDHEGHQDSE